MYFTTNFKKIKIFLRKHKINFKKWLFKFCQLNVLAKSRALVSEGPQLNPGSSTWEGYLISVRHHLHKCEIEIWIIPIQNYFVRIKHDFAQKINAATLFIYYIYMHKVCIFKMH